MKIVVDVDAAFVADDDGNNVADIALIGGLATGLFGGANVARQQADLAARQDADLRDQAALALACDYCPPHLLADRAAMQAAVRADRNTAGPKVQAHFDARQAWANAIAPGLPIVRRGA